MRLSPFVYRIVFCLCIFFLTGGNSYAQSSGTDAEFTNFENTHKDTLSDGMYIDSTFMMHYNLKNIPQSLKRLKAWENPQFYDSKDFIKVCDIRWKFNSNAEAESFYTKFMAQNSENGEEITDSGIKIDGVSDLRIFREGAGMRKMINSMGKPMNFYYFLFVVNNCVAKVFVCTKPDIKVKDACVFAYEAARRLIAYYDYK
jgi:hypothetical protein